jgi:RNA polymerase-interacting CarD/CdnL/TRCF family regulator
MLLRGDNVVHRGHGAATVTGVVRSDSAPMDCRYYQLDLVASDTRVLVPVEHAEETLRPLSSTTAIDGALKAVEGEAKLDRVRGRHDRMRAELLTGQVHAAAEVICRLRALKRKRDLTFVDRQIMRRATALLAAEVAHKTHCVGRG